MTDPAPPQAPAAEELGRMVIGVDPPASAAGTGGIVACGLDRKGVAHVLAGHSAGGLSPEGWARRVARAIEAHGADRVIAEKNQGGDMGKAVLGACFDKLSMSGAVSVSLVSVSHGKGARAEPVAARFEAGRGAAGGQLPRARGRAGGHGAGGAMKAPAARPIVPKRWSGRYGRC